MAVQAARKQRVERAQAIREAREEWWALRKAVEAERGDAVIWRLQRLQKAKGMHRLTLAELLVAGGTVR